MALLCQCYGGLSRSIVCAFGIVASLAGHLLWHGVDPEVATELLLAWNVTRCRPPLEPEEVVCTVASISCLHQQGEDRDN